MTGGSLPAMTWQRLMDYAHQNIDLKPIPGIENPFVDPAAIAKAKEEASKTATAEPPEAIERPPVLSAATTRVLKAMSDEFRSAPPIQPPARAETLSAL